jgi:hypothetical protein
VILIGPASRHIINNQYWFGIGLFGTLRIGGGFRVAVTWDEAVVAQHVQALGPSLLELVLGCDMI